MIDSGYAEKLNSLPVEAKRLWRAILRGTFSFEKSDPKVNEDMVLKLVHVGFIKDLVVGYSRFMFIVVDWSLLLGNSELFILNIVADGGLTSEKYEDLYKAKADVATMDAAIEKLEELGLIVRDEKHDYILTF